MHLSILIAAALSVVSSVLASSILEARQCIGPHVNKATLALIKEFEGFVPRPEPDPIGLPTVGYGHLCKTKGCKEVKFPLSKGTATTLLKKDLRSFQQAITLSTKTAVKLNANQYGALVSWAYNVGPNAARSSSLISRLNQGEDPNQVIAQELPKWRLAGGKVFEGLVRRRKAEVKLAKTPTKSKALPQQHAVSCKVAASVSSGYRFRGLDGAHLDRVHMIHVAQTSRAKQFSNTGGAKTFQPRGRGV
ncbi:predicted protein [Histoplasma mississippiense (nom. inval.)]|uniref:predicted protein n=1 Tax=Ajellomyces capsulatus (strain NAm1 / WU24) TaxID=2059318 RepID=UPI000157C4FD|nr:predicted protein [Histoplasma mississippiense (nom. inval.)]EDN08523.1 predicted protein [Histoplasma mississippiense (nom. inval.)]